MFFNTFNNFWCFSLGLQGSPTEWVSTHRYHHQFVDSERDPHSPTAGFWFSHMSWIFDTTSMNERVWVNNIFLLKLKHGLMIVYFGCCRLILFLVCCAVWRTKQCWRFTEAAILQVSWKDLLYSSNCTWCSSIWLGRIPLRSVGNGKQDCLIFSS